MRATVVAAAIMVLAPGGAHAVGRLGIWTNPSRSVRVDAHPCGKKFCGTVIWASPKAKADSARGGNKQLVGMQLFRGLTPDKPNVWRGKVYVPDIDKTFSGTLTLINPQSLVAKGCLFGGVACTSQTWTRLR